VIGVADGSDVRGAGAGDAARRAELGAFLRARRAAVKPGDVGLPEGTSRRRTPGLRREEVAQLAGVGIAWYTWLEQGRVLATSPQVIDAVARALLLTHEEHAHLRALANLPPPTRPDRGGVLAASIRRMVDNLSPNPAYVLDRRFDFLTWNDAYCRVWRDLAAIPPDRRNLIWLFFTDESLRSLVVDWEARAAALLAQFHAVVGRNPADQRLAQLVHDLTANSPLFQRWWPEYRVGGLGSPRHVIRHPEVGEIRFDLAQLRIDHQPGLTLVLQTPATPADRDRLIALLAT
jgi:transcriptional regulator with XRE-family HTH domain